MQQELKQGSIAWLEWRRRGIGASEMSIILGVNKFRSIYDLWLEKVGMGTPIQETEAMRLGKEREPLALQLYEVENNCILNKSPAPIVHPEYSFIFASLDAMNQYGIPIEVKAGGEKTHAIAKSGKIPELYYPQLQCQMACTNAPYAWYVSFDGQENVVIKVTRDDEYIKKMIAEAIKFWHYVENFIAPPKPEDKYETINDESFAIWSKAYLDAKAHLKECQKMVDEYKNVLLKLSNEKEVKGYGIQITQRTGRKTYDMEKISSENNIDLEKYRKTGASYWEIKEIGEDND